MKRLTYVQIAITCVKDFGTLAAAKLYCERVTAQNGEDAMAYKMAAESIDDVIKTRKTAKTEQVQ